VKEKSFFVKVSLFLRRDRFRLCISCSSFGDLSESVFSKDKYPSEEKVVKMSTIAVEAPNTPHEKRDKLGELAEGMDNVKISESEEKIVEINESSDPEKIIKHPLQNAWTLWFFKNDKARSWEENQRPIITVTTVEDFWSLYNHIEVASRLPPGSDYSLFKEGIFPDWEDPRNQAGGRWLINLDKRQRADCLDTYWLEILFFLIGEHADQHAHQVNGAVVNVRGKGDKLAVWLADASQQDSLVRIGKMIKERLGIDPEQTIGFNIHNEEKARPGSSIKKKFFV